MISKNSLKILWHLEAHRKILLFILLLAFLLRISAVVVFRHTIIDMGFTEKNDDFARNFLAGKAFGLIPGVPSSYTQPFYGFFLVVIYFLFGRTALSIGISQAAISTATVFLTYLVGKKAFHQKAGLLAAFFVAIYPYFIYHDIHVNRTVLITFFLTLTMLLLLELAENPKAMTAILTGLVIGMYGLTNSVILGFTPLWCLWLLWRFDFDYKKTIRMAGSVVLFIMLTLSPWVIRNYFVHHALVLASTDGGRAFWKANNEHTLEVISQNLGVDHVPEPPDRPGPSPMDKGLTQWEFSEVQLDKWYYNKAFEFIKHNPRMKSQLMLANLINFWNIRHNPRSNTVWEGNSTMLFLKHISYTLSYTPIFVLFILGFLWSRGRWKTVSLLVLLILYYTFVMINMSGITRYRVPLDPVLSIFAGHAVFTGYDKIKGQLGVWTGRPMPE